MDVTNLLITTLAIVPLAASFIAEKSGVVDKLKHWLFYRRYTKHTEYRHFSMKPVDCAMCSSFYLATLVEIIEHEPINSLTIMLPFAAACVGSLISRI